MISDIPCDTVFMVTCNTGDTARATWARPGSSADSHQYIRDVDLVGNVATAQDVIRQGKAHGKASHVMVTRLNWGRRTSSCQYSWIWPTSDFP